MTRKKKIDESTNENVLELPPIFSRGYGLAPQVVARAVGLSHEAKSIYFYLASFAGTGNTVFPKTQTILYELDMTKKMFYEHRTELAAWGFIKFKTTATANGSRTVYTLPDTPICVKDEQSTVDAVPAAPIDSLADARSIDEDSNSKLSKSEFDAFSHLCSLSIKPVKKAMRNSTMQTYIQRLSAGWSPDEIERAYERYADGYRKTNTTPVFAKQLWNWLVDADGLSFYCPKTKKHSSASSTNGFSVASSGSTDPLKAAVEDKSCATRLGVFGIDAVRNLTKNDEMGLTDKEIQKTDAGYAFVCRDLKYSAAFTLLHKILYMQAEQFARKNGYLFSEVKHGYEQ